jgi:ABC-type dipeptide/oligopeptide/nickel transport system ATPase component
MKNPYAPILKQIATRMLEAAEIKPNYSNDAFTDAVLIFQSVLIDKLYDSYKDYPLELQENRAQVAGEELRNFILKFTSLDTIELVKNYGNER